MSVGVELEDDQENRTNDDGVINGVRLFKCPPGRALFVQPEQCTVDRRFQDIKSTSSSTHKSSDKNTSDYFGQIECPVVEGAVAPLSTFLFCPTAKCSYPKFRNLCAIERLHQIYFYLLNRNSKSSRPGKRHWKI